MGGYPRTMDQPTSITTAIAALDGPWQPADLATANETIVRVARLDGAFPWHRHDEDEMFLCWDGSFVIEMRDRPSVTLRSGDLFVVPCGVEHRPVADDVAHAILVERPDTLQYGN